MNRKHLASVGITLGTLLGGVAFGSMFIGPSASVAQEAGDETPSSDTNGTAAGTEEESEHCHHRFGGPRHHLATVAEALGMTPDEVREALQGGQTIAELADSKGVEVQTVIDAIVDDIEEHLAQAVEDGRLTQAEADEKAANAEERATALVNGELPPRHEGPGPFGGHRHGEPDEGTGEGDGASTDA
jgi:hypothetical protein